MRELTYAQAIREAIREEMLRDDSVYLMGEDVGVYGGACGVSKGLLEEFGPARVLDTPISESAIVGAGTGSAVTGMRPIVELMFVDFTAVCFDQIINQAAKLRYMSGGKVSVPMVIRMACGGGTGAAAQHSQSLEALFCHIPGLKVVMPSTPRDARGLLKSAVRDDNCIVFLEHKLLYRTSGPVPEGGELIELGRADIKREGSDVSVITYGRGLQMALTAAETLAREGVGVEVLDLRSLSPLDKDAILKTAAKTGRVVVAHEAVTFGGFGGEIAAAIAESEAFSRLKAPVKRVGARFCPAPFALSLEQAMLPGAEDIERAIRELM